MKKVEKIEEGIVGNMKNEKLSKLLDYIDDKIKLHIEMINDTLNLARESFEKKDWECLALDVIDIHEAAIVVNVLEDIREKLKKVK